MHFVVALFFMEGDVMKNPGSRTFESASENFCRALGTTLFWRLHFSYIEAVGRCEALPVQCSVCEARWLFTSCLPRRCQEGLWRSRQGHLLSLQHVDGRWASCRDYKVVNVAYALKSQHRYHDLGSEKSILHISDHSSSCIVCHKHHTCRAFPSPYQESLDMV